MPKTKTTVAAIDLGATSGRVIVGTFSRAEGLELTEVHRFPNAFHELNGYAYWDVGGLFTEVKQGLIEAKKLFPDLSSCGIDTWGVDYALVDVQGRLVYPVHAYRDARTESIRENIIEKGDDRDLYDWTGLPPINYNSGLQLYETLQRHPKVAELADRVLFLPDYYNFLLCGTMVNEFSIVSTTQLLDVRGESLSRPALEYFGVPERWFDAPAKAGRKLGPIRDVGGLEDVEVVLVPGHDTSSAFEAIPQTKGSFIVSSGTWLLAGAMLPKPCIGEEAYQFGISNERCGDGSYRPCKILIGLWMIERTLPAFDTRPRNDAEWSALITAAVEKPAPEVLLDTEDRKSFFNPRDMKAAIDAQLKSKGATPPDDLAGYIRLICDSLGQSMANACTKFEELTGSKFDDIVIVGGGSKNRLLCQRTADFSGRPVISYQLEATSVGNIGYQLLGLGAVDSLETYHTAILDGLNKQVFKPRG